MGRGQGGSRGEMEEEKNQQSLNSERADSSNCDPQCSAWMCNSFLEMIQRNLVILQI